MRGGDRGAVRQRLREANRITRERLLLPSMDRNDPYCAPEICNTYGRACIYAIMTGDLPGALAAARGRRRRRPAARHARHGQPPGPAARAGRTVPRRDRICRADVGSVGAGRLCYRDRLIDNNLKDEEPEMNGTPYFDRLFASAERIARHADYPGKEQAVGQCLKDIDDLAIAERITAEQRETLRSVLLGSVTRGLSPTSAGDLRAVDARVRRARHTSPTRKRGFSGGTLACASGWCEDRPRRRARNSIVNRSNDRCHRPCQVSTPGAAGRGAARRP